MKNLPFIILTSGTSLLDEVKDHWIIPFQYILCYSVRKPSPEFGNHFYLKCKESRLFVFISQSMQWKAFCKKGGEPIIYLVKRKA